MNESKRVAFSIKGKQSDWCNKVFSSEFDAFARKGETLCQKQTA
jgi:hypothetical protein